MLGESHPPRRRNLGADRIRWLLLTIEDGQIVAMRYGRPGSFEPYYLDFRSFVRAADPGAPTQMWWTTSADRSFPVLTEESFELFEQYTNQYVNSLTE